MKKTRIMPYDDAVRLLRLDIEQDLRDFPGLREAVGDHAYLLLPEFVDILRRIRDSMVNPKDVCPSLGEIQELLRLAETVEF